MDAVSLWIQPVGDEAPLLSVHPDVPRNPASAIKLLTTLAALEKLTPVYTWKTRIYTFAPVVDGVLLGDLYIRGGGDPYLVSSEVWKLAGALRQKGIQHILGDLVFDLSHFELPLEDPGNFDGQPFLSYNQPPHPLLMHFNAIKMDFRVGKNGNFVEVALDPPLTGLHVENLLNVGSRPCGGFEPGVIFHVEYNGPEPLIRLEGELSRFCEPFSLQRTLLSPEVYAYGLFAALWKQWSGTLEGAWRLGSVPDPHGTPLVVHESPPLGDLVRLVNKKSLNVVARHMKLALGAELYGTPGTPAKGNTAIFAMLEEMGIDPAGLVLDNAAGLSRTNRISARQLAGILRFGLHSRFMPEYISSLALPGMDGTLSRRFVGDPEMGNMHLKTGYLKGVSSIAGYVRSVAGRHLIIVLLINHENATRLAGVEIQDAVLRWAYRQ